MNGKFRLSRLLERLSLDAVAVAIIWGCALGAAAGRHMRLAEAIVLGLATWLTYVADRLRDTGPGRVVPETDRHMYYKRHYRGFRAAWVGVLVVSILLAVVYFPVWKLLWGWVLVGAVGLYLWLLGLALPADGRLLLKRLAVPLIFTAGVGWMAESWRSGDGWLATGVLLAGAWANVLVISYWERRDVREFRWLAGLLALSLLLLVGLAVESYWFGMPGKLAAVVCLGGTGYLALLVRSGRAHEVRAWADGILAIAGLVLWLAAG